MQEDALKLLRAANQLAGNINRSGSSEQCNKTLTAIQVNGSTMSDRTAELMVLWLLP
jgi:hypothetical protein